ncbi:hypothetical protein GCK72_010612 [Caenorhabditis remanei]|uniref:G-protein coupled receptors family 1 profile domain-containing protein n=1 Tax=Caenorhabditis remanei TaxID=31234 RepID=A0A6A5H3C0_CAERE|nr:hypothetical protein GCK72_010612 [Caenorhabditis remanei]KAF1762350.1 hypothetical protein GCK72_010612 [Caenorhabditis remanei]
MDSLLLSYMMISLLTYFGVVHSSFYRSNVTLRSLYFTLGIIWGFSLTLAIPLSLYQAAVNSPGPIECDLHYCLKVVEWITFSFACICLLLNVLLTGFVVISLYWHHFKAKKNGIEVPEVTSRARVRLTFTFFALVIVCFVELFPFGILIGFDQSGLQKCESFYQSDKLLIQVIVSSIETFLGSLVFVADPLINICFDKNILQTVKLQDISISHSIRLWMGFYIPSVICFLAILVDIYCLVITIFLLRSLNQQTRKRYVFVLVRLSSAILVAICIILVQSTNALDAPFQDSYTYYAIFFVVYDFSIFSLLGSFTGVAVITYFGVMRPLFYRDRLTPKVMYWAAAGICIVSACISIPIGLFQAADSADGPIRCDSTSCQVIVKWLLFSISCVILIGATSTLLFVTISLYWHNYKSKKMGNLTSSASDHGRARLAWTTAVLIILSCVELIPTGLLLAYGKCDIHI